MLFLLVIVALAGILVGTQLSLFIQGVILFLIILYFNTDDIKYGGLAALAPIAIGLWFIVGMLVGDISYALQTDAINQYDISNPFVVEGE